MLYNIWGFVRQTAVRIHLAGAKTIYKISGGKLPKSLYCKRANPEKIPTDDEIQKAKEIIKSITNFVVLS